jgi:hypothetical protein
LLLFNLFKELSFSKSGAKIEEKYRLPNFPETFFSTSACRLKNTSIKNGMQIYGNTPIQQTVHQNIFILIGKNLIVRSIFFDSAYQSPGPGYFESKFHYLRTDEIAY